VKGPLVMKGEKFINRDIYTLIDGSTCDARIFASCAQYRIQGSEKYEQ